MNWLFGLFMLGSAAVVFPFIFHLIRQTPKGRQEFSSLMFLQPTPPRLTRRSRLDDILLLILRGLVIVLLAFAFTRPFWRAAADLSMSGIRGRRVAILVDTSASMRRGSAWNQATRKVDEVLKSLEPADDAALFTFDRDLKTVVDFNDPDKETPNDKPALIRSQLKDRAPTWNQTDLGTALIRAAEILDETIDREESDDALQIIVISDMQRGADLKALQIYEWPEDVRVEIKKVAPADPSNASLQLLAGADGESSQAEPRVRVTNGAEAAVEQFLVSWVGEKNRPGDDAVTFYVPPGQSRVLPVPRGQSDLTADRLVLTGDGAEFDNQHFVVPVRQEEFRLAYLGDEDPADAEGLLFYLDQVLVETAERKVLVSQFETDKNVPLLVDELPHLVVLARPVSEAEQTALDGYARAGGHVLVVLSDEKQLASLGELLPGAKLDPIQTASGSEYRMLGQIDFTHPLFVPFASPRYNDFTGIRFWKYRSVTLPEDAKVNIVARFDNGKPALWEQPLGQGKVYGLASGWQPAESQLALSNKFLPLVEELLEECTPRRLQATAYLVGDVVPLPSASSGDRRVVLRPDGGEFLVPGDAASFAGTVEPGIYRLKTNGAERVFAVNLPQSESETQPMEVEQLEQRGIRLGTQATRSEEYERLRQLRDRELESKQKMWKWLVVLALVVVGAETWLAGRRAAKSPEVSGSGEPA